MKAVLLNLMTLVALAMSVNSRAMGDSAASSAGFGDAARGEAIFSSRCAGCHGSSGAGLPTPSLFGQYEQYLITELTNFKEDKRADSLMFFMNGLAKGLSEQEIRDVALYLSQQSPCAIPVAVDPGKGRIEEGRKKIERWVCAGCHIAGSQYYVGDKYNAPFLDGQKTPYLIYELKQFKGKTRVSRFMNDMAAGLSTQDIDDIAAFWNSRRKCSN